MEDPRSLVFLMGGAARMYKGQQASFRDIDLAVVTSKGPVYKKLASIKFKREIQNLVGREVDIHVFKRQHFKPGNVLREVSLEKKQQLFPIHSLAHGVPLYNIERAKNFQKRLENYLNMTYDSKDREEMQGWLVRRSLTKTVEKIATGELNPEKLTDLAKMSDSDLRAMTKKLNLTEEEKKKLFEEIKKLRARNAASRWLWLK
jgi:predicted nucleotidyltransferase